MRRSAPPSRRWVAKECLKVGKSAGGCRLQARIFTICQTYCLVRPLPLRLRKSFLLAGLKRGRNFAMYSESEFLGNGMQGHNALFRALADYRTRRFAANRDLRSRLHSSDTRKAGSIEQFQHAAVAKSRRDLPSGGISSNVAISSWLRTSGKCMGNLGLPMFLWDYLLKDLHQLQNQKKSAGPKDAWPGCACGKAAIALPGKNRNTSSLAGKGQGNPGWLRSEFQKAAYILKIGNYSLARQPLPGKQHMPQGLLARPSRPLFSMGIFYYSILFFGNTYFQKGHIMPAPPLEAELARSAPPAGVYCLASGILRKKMKNVYICDEQVFAILRITV